MAYEMNDNSGALFRNDKKGNASRPDYTGKVKVGGIEYRLAAWVKTPQRGGAKFLSISVTQADRDTREDTPAPPVTYSDYTPAYHADDDIPF